MKEATLIIPKSWSDISINQWRQITTIQKEEDYDVAELYGCVCQSNGEVIRSLSIPDFQTIRSKLSFLNNKIKEDITTKFTINGKDYAMTPRLDMDFLTAGELLDLESWQQDSIKNLHLICALIYRPIKHYISDEDYSIEPYEYIGFMQRAKIFEDNLSIDKVLGSVLFFSTFGLNCMTIIQDYLEAAVKKQKNQMMKKVKNPVVKKMKTTRTQRPMKKKS